MYKSTRDIAREAVENEVKRAGRGKRKRNVDDSSDDDDGKKQTNKKHERKNDQRRHTGSIHIPSNEPSELARLAGKYRDRAKERQQGILPVIGVDDLDAVDMTSGRRPVANNADDDDDDDDDDDVLFDSVVAAVESGDRQALDRITTLARSTTTVGGTLPETASDALKWLTNPQNVPKTAFGQEICDYLRQKYRLTVNRSAAISVSAAGKSLLKSVLTFRQPLQADPRDRERSWERPSEQTFAATTTVLDDHHRNDDTDRENGIIPKASVVLYHTELMQKIQHSFDNRNRRDEVRSDASEHSTSQVANVIQTTTKESDDDDDDIFASVGEYIPHDDNNDPTTTNDTLSSSSPTIRHHHMSQSIFGDKKEVPDKCPDVELSSMPQSLTTRLSSMRGYDHDDHNDDGIGLDFDGPMYDDDDDDDDEQANHQKQQKRRSKARGRQ